MLLVSFGLVLPFVSAALPSTPSGEPHTIHASTLAARHSALLRRVRSYDRTQPTVIGGKHSMSVEDDGVELYPRLHEIHLNTLGKEFKIKLEKNEKMLGEEYRNIKSVHTHRYTRVCGGWMGGVCVWRCNSSSPTSVDSCVRIRISKPFCRVSFFRWWWSILTHYCCVA